MSYQNQDPIGKMLSMLLMGMWRGLKSIYKGLKKLNKPANIAALAVTIIVSVLSYIGKAKFAIVFAKLEVLTDTRISVIIQKGFWGIMIALPVIFLMILGQIESKVQNIYEKIIKYLISYIKKRLIKKLYMLFSPTFHLVNGIRQGKD